MQAPPTPTAPGIWRPTTICTTTCRCTWPLSNGFQTVQADPRRYVSHIDHAGPKGRAARFSGIDPRGTLDDLAAYRQFADRHRARLGTAHSRSAADPHAADRPAALVNDPCPLNRASGCHQDRGARNDSAVVLCKARTTPGYLDARQRCFARAISAEPKSNSWRARATVVDRPLVEVKTAFRMSPVRKLKWFFSRPRMSFTWNSNEPVPPGC